MEKTKREAAIKKLQTELKEEKQAEISRFVWLYSHNTEWRPHNPTGRRRAVTLERKKAAEERRRLEEEKAKVMVAAY
jgi:rRNA-processing protein CGR1